MRPIFVLDLRLQLKMTAQSRAWDHLTLPLIIIFVVCRWEFIYILFNPHFCMHWKVCLPCLWFHKSIRIVILFSFFVSNGYGKSLICSFYVLYIVHWLLNWKIFFSVFPDTTLLKREKQLGIKKNHNLGFSCKYYLNM